MLRTIGPNREIKLRKKKSPKWLYFLEHCKPSTEPIGVGNFILIFPFYFTPLSFDLACERQRLEAVHSLSLWRVTLCYRVECEALLHSVPASSYPNSGESPTSLILTFLSLN